VRIYIFLIVFFCLASLQAQPLQIKSGILDLGKLDLNNSRVIPLHGEWQFLNEAFYTADQMKAIEPAQFTD
jgi:hypothetical protein